MASLFSFEKKRNSMSGCSDEFKSYKTHTAPPYCFKTNETNHFLRKKNNPKQKKIH